MTDDFYNDKPITEPTGDLYRLDPFAQALAASIRKMASPEGTVLALNGPWGSGKSSTINLIKHHLQAAVAGDELVLLDFKPWWFKGDDALALAFFRELYAGMGPSLGEKFKKALPKLGARVLQSGSLVAEGLAFAGMSGIGKLLSSGMQTAAGLIGNNGETVDKLHRELSQSLRDQSKRFLIIIDDIDRLTPDEALMIFRLVKSVGHLPNVIYLLVFDRTLADKIARDRFPSEGPQYLEKIIQVSFDLPPAEATDLQRQMQEIIFRICGQPTEEKVVRFMNVFYDVVSPEIKSPRDIVRLGNALPVTWAAIGKDVDLCDFVGLETLRVLRSDVYRRLRANKDKLLLGSIVTRDEKMSADELDKLLFGSPLPNDSRRLRSAIMRVFPPLERHWNNVHYGDGSQAEWDKQRRACSKGHIDTYFRFALGAEAMSASDIEHLMERAGDEKFIEETMLSALDVVHADGTTNASMILEHLNIHADEIKDKDVEPLLKALFRVCDRLNVPQDQAKGFSIGSNPLRIHWLLRRLTRERFDDAKRSSVLKAAAAEASFGWLVDFSESAYRDHHPREGKVPPIDHVILMTAEDAEAVRQLTLSRIRSAASSGELLGHKELPYILFRWREMQAADSKENESAAVVAWTNSQLENDEGVVALARAFTGTSWVHDSGDVVAKQRTTAMIDSIKMVIDRDRFRQRIEELASGSKLAPDARAIVTTFLDAWKRRDKSSEDD